MEGSVRKDEQDVELGCRHLLIIDFNYGCSSINDREQEDRRHARVDGFKDPLINQEEAD